MRKQKKGVYVCRNNQENLHCTNNKLRKIILGENMLTLFCQYNYLTELDLNEKLEGLYCYDNLITELTLNKNMEELYCDGNVKLYNFTDKFFTKEELYWSRLVKIYK